MIQRRTSSIKACLEQVVVNNRLRFRVDEVDELAVAQIDNLAKIDFREKFVVIDGLIGSLYSEFSRIVGRRFVNATAALHLATHGAPVVAKFNYTMADVHDSDDVNAITKLDCYAWTPSNGTDYVDLFKQFTAAVRGCTVSELDFSRVRRYVVTHFTVEVFEVVAREQIGL